MRIVFFGTPHFARTILEYLLEQGVEVAAVVTRPDKPRGRSKAPAFSPVKEFALAHHLPLYQPLKASDPEFAAFLKELEADFFIVAAYAEILKENILQIPRFGCLNVHGSILPKYRGAAPVQRAIIAGEKETGVTIMKMALQMDAGDLLAIRKTPIHLEMTAGELMEVLADLGKRALWEVMQALPLGTINAAKQDPSQVTFAKKLTREEGELNWSRPALALHRHVCGFTPNPGAWCWVAIRGEKKRLLLKKTFPNLLSGEPGAILSANPTELIIACGEGSLRILELQLEGKKPLTAEGFLRGISLAALSFIC